MVEAVIKMRGSPYGIMVNMLDCNILVSEFEPQSHFYAYFQTNTLGKSVTSIMPPAID